MLMFKLHNILQNYKHWTQVYLKEISVKKIVQ
jgi:hypothetical protein